MGNFALYGGIIASIMYTLVVAGCIFLFKSFNIRNRNIVRYLVALSGLFHLLYLAALTSATGRLPVETVFEGLTAVAFFITATYALIQYTSGEAGTGIVVFPLVLVIQLMSVPGIAGSESIHSLRGFQGLLSIMGYAAFLISVLYSLMYVLMHSQIKRRNFGLIFDRFPSLDALDKLNKKAVATGFILLSGAVIYGTALKGSLDFEPREMSDAALWVIYGSSILMRKFSGWQGKRVAYFSLSAGALLLSTFFMYSGYLQVISI